MRRNDQTASQQSPAADKSLTKTDYEALAAFRGTLRRFFAFSEEAAKATGLAPQQHQALLAIRGAPGRDCLSVGEIAGVLLIRPHSAAELVDRLAQLDLVRRAIDPKDHRRVWVALTPRAETVLQDLSTAHLRELRQIRPTLSALLARFAGTAEPSADPLPPGAGSAPGIIPPLPAPGKVKED
jgi:DNA-binding MarR family transcriptional regulator